MNSTIETPAPPDAAATQSGAGDGDAWIVILVKMPKREEESFHDAVLYTVFLERALNDARIAFRAASAIGTLSHLAGGVFVNRSDLQPAIRAIRAMMDEVPDSAPYSAIFYNFTGESIFRTSYCGSELGPPITLTVDMLEEWRAEPKRMLAEKLAALQRKEPPPDDPPAAGASPTA